MGLSGLNMLALRFSLLNPHRTSRSYRPKLVTAGIGKAAYRGGA
ncbi:hypothetical protein ACVWZL_005330 [Bradyrhizobium sp. GM2.4]